MPPAARKLLAPFEEMAENRETVSDRIISKAKTLGFREDEALSDDAARQLAVEYSNLFLDDLEKTQKLVEEHHAA